MPVETIVLSLPEAARETDISDRSDSRLSTRRHQELVRGYQQLLKKRRRFAWTDRARQRREEVFATACKSLAKQLARESTEEVEDRADRLKARTRAYTAFGSLMTVSASEAERSALRNYSALRLALLFGILGGATLSALITAGLGDQIPF